VSREVIGKPETGEGCMRVLRLEACSLRTVADDDLAALPGHAQESLDVFFYRDPPHIGGDRPWQLEKALGCRLEQFGVHAPAPCRQVPEAARFEVAAHRCRAHHAACGGAMKAVQCPVGESERNGKPRPKVLGKLGVVRGGEAQLPSQTVGARGESQRTLGRYVQGLRLEFGNFLPYPPSRQQGQANLRVGRAGDVAKILGRQHPDLVTEAAQPVSRLRQGTDDPVGLRKPGVRDDHDSHVGRRSHVCMTNV